MRVWVIGAGASTHPITVDGRAAHAGGQDHPPPGRAQPPVGHQQQRQGDGQRDADRPQGVPGQGRQHGDRRERAVVAEQLVDPGVPGDVGGPGQAGAGVQPADRVARAGAGSGPARRRRTAARWRPRRRRSPARRRSAAGSPSSVTTSPPTRQAEGGQEQEPGEQGPATRLQLHWPPSRALGHPGAGHRRPRRPEPSRAAVRERYGPARRAAWLTYGQWRQPLSQQVPRSHR